MSKWPRGSADILRAKAGQVLASLEHANRNENRRYKDQQNEGGSFESVPEREPRRENPQNCQQEDEGLVEPIFQSVWLRFGVEGSRVEYALPQTSKTESPTR